MPTSAGMGRLFTTLSAHAFVDCESIPVDSYWMQTAATLIVTTADTAVAGTEPVTDQPLA
jgi:hypothetical protein